MSHFDPSSNSSVLSAMVNDVIWIFSSMAVAETASGILDFFGTHLLDESQRAIDTVAGRYGYPLTALGGSVIPETGVYQSDCDDPDLEARGMGVMEHRGQRSFVFLYDYDIVSFYSPDHPEQSFTARLD